MRRAWLALIGVVSFVLPSGVGACGSSNTADLFSGPGGGATADGAVDGTAALDDGATAEDANGVDAGKLKDAGKKVDADVPVVDAGVDVAVPGDLGIFCGFDPSATRTFCSINSQACCVRNVAGTLDFSCRPSSGSGSACAGLRVPCSDSLDCTGGKVCCAFYDELTNLYTDVSCKSSCGASGTTFTEYQMCDPEAPNDECVASKRSCQASSAIDGWYLCKD